MTEMELSGVSISLPPWGPGENLPKLSCVVSMAVSVEITSAVIWPVTVEESPGWASAAKAKTRYKVMRLMDLVPSLFIYVRFGQ
jgi:hypothetical protein